MKVVFLFTVLLTFSALMNFAEAAGDKNTNLIAVGQGISSPNSTSTINYSSGYTSESPLGTLYQGGFRITGEFDKDENNEAYGAEIGYSQGEWGIAAGQRKSNCSGCKATSAAAIGLNISDFGVGFRFADDIYAAAILLNPRGVHRFGVMVQANQTGGNGHDITAMGLGYSYVNSSFTFTIDASKNNFEDKTVKDDRMLVTPGIMLRADVFQFSVNDKITLNRDKNNSAQPDKDSELWFGLGIGGDKWHAALYSKYVSDLAVAVTYFF